MTLSTSIHLAEYHNPQLVFLKAREIIGIPGEHPFRTITPGLGWENGEWIASTPGGFRSALDVSHANGDLLLCKYERETPAPDAYVDVRLDTAYGYRGAEGGCVAVHEEVVARLGAWLDEQGVDWWADNEFDGTWHHGTTPYAAEAAS